MKEHQLPVRARRFQHAVHSFRRITVQQRDNSKLADLRSLRGEEKMLRFIYLLLITIFFIVFCNCGPSVVEQERKQNQEQCIVGYLFITYGPTSVTPQKKEELLNELFFICWIQLFSDYSKEYHTYN
jgi:hypothetical protein